MADLFYSFGNQHPGPLVLNNYPRFMQELSVPGNPFFDMGTVDIVRARERGVPRYNEFRRQLGLNPIRSFDDLTDDADAVDEAEVRVRPRPADVEELDLLIGTLAEGHRPTGFGFGETMFQIFILNATPPPAGRPLLHRLLQRGGLHARRACAGSTQTDLKTVLLRHHPELADTGLANIKQRLRAVGRRAEARSRAPSTARLRPRIEARPVARRRVPPCLSISGGANADMVSAARDLGTS